MFAPKDFEHGELRCGSSALNPVLGRRLVRPDEQGVTGKEITETAELTKWVLDNIQLPRGVKNATQ